MKLTSDGIRDGQPIPRKHALGKHDESSHATFSDNVSPHLAWSDLPAGTKSLALVVHDPDVPSKPDDVNKEGRTVPASLPRVDFFHCVLVDIPPDASPIREGELASGVTKGGKDGPEGPRGMRWGRNSYTDWFAGDPDMGGTYFGYDGPFPPWNDEIVHHYHFTLYALDVDRCPLEGELSAPEVRKAIEGHVLGEAKIVATYAINPNAK